jgi:hypothetical protein
VAVKVLAPATEGIPAAKITQSSADDNPIFLEIRIPILSVYCLKNKVLPIPHFPLKILKNIKSSLTKKTILIKVVNVKLP